MKNSGIVINVDGDYLEIVSVRPSACGTSCENCHAHCESKPEIIKVLNTIDAKTGDNVELEINSASVLSYIGLVYGLPLIVFISSILISSSILGESKQMFSLLIGVFNLVITYLIIKVFDSNLKISNSEIKLRKIA